MSVMCQQFLLDRLDPQKVPGSFCAVDSFGCGLFERFSMTAHTRSPHDRARTAIILSSPAVPRTRFMKAVRSTGGMCHTVAAPSNLPILLTIAATTCRRSSSADQCVRLNYMPPSAAAVACQCRRCDSARMVASAADAAWAAGSHDT